MKDLHIMAGPGVEVRLEEGSNNIVYFYFGGKHMENVPSWCTSAKKESIGELIIWLTEWYIEHDTPSK